jgi:hypothetical protein
MMDFPSFRRSLDEAIPPGSLDAALCALWWDAKGDWQEAHRCAQAEEGGRAAWVHAYLHRKEGDAANAAYWYRRSGKTAPEAPLPEEWEAIARALLAASPAR